MLRLPIRVALLFAMSFLAACFFLKGHYEGASFALVTSAQQSYGSIQKQRTDRDVIDEAAKPSDPAEQLRREAKNRYEWLRYGEAASHSGALHLILKQSRQWRLSPSRTWLPLA